MLWIHFDKDKKVCEVYAKQYIYFGADDEDIYGFDHYNNQFVFNIGASFNL